MTGINAWVVCSPGDVTNAQRRTARALAGGCRFTATMVNERSGWIQISVWRMATATRAFATEDRYSISPDGRETHYLGTFS